MNNANLINMVIALRNEQTKLTTIKMMLGNLPGIANSEFLQTMTN